MSMSVAELSMSVRETEHKIDQLGQMLQDLSKDFKSEMERMERLYRFNLQYIEILFATVGQERNMLKQHLLNEQTALQKLNEMHAEKIQKTSSIVNDSDSLLLHIRNELMKSNGSVPYSNFLSSLVSAEAVPGNGAANIAAQTRNPGPQQSNAVDTTASETQANQDMTANQHVMTMVNSNGGIAVNSPHDGMSLEGNGSDRSSGRRRNVQSLADTSDSNLLMNYDPTISGQNDSFGSSEEAPRKRKRSKSTAMYDMTPSTSLETMWLEYSVGLIDKPPLKELEAKYKSVWRGGSGTAVSKKFSRRRKFYEYMERELANGTSMQDAIARLHEHRKYDMEGGAFGERSISWLLENIPMD